MKDERGFRVDGDTFSVFFDSEGNLQRILFSGRMFDISRKFTIYEVDGEAADVSKITKDKEMVLELVSKKASGRLILYLDREVKMRFEPDKGSAVNNFGLVIPFPITTEFHLPEIYNLGRKIDRSMPMGDYYSTSLGYNFFLANCNGIWIRFMVKQIRPRSSSVHISRHPKIFITSFNWKAGEEASLAVFSSMNEAIIDYQTWLERDLGIRKLRDRPNLPEWIHNVRFTFTIDMMRSNREIAHNYEDVTNLAKELKKIGCPKDTLFYMPGWNGPFDSIYPTYRPHPELGGEKSFRKMIDCLHENGFRVMIHTNGWGLDPYRPDIEKYLKYVLRDEDGNYQGWQTGGKIWGGSYPASRPLKFRSKRAHLRAPKGVRAFTFKTVPVPDAGEALIAVGNIKIGDARLKLTIGNRSVLTPAGWFKDHEEYAFPFPLVLKTGTNRVHLEVLGPTGKGEPEWRESWYQIRCCFIPTTSFAGFTYPILLADMNNPEWIKIFVDEVASVVREFKIDAVDIDATHYERARKLLDALQERLPEIPKGGEELETLLDLGYSTFIMNARPTLLGYSDVMQPVVRRGLPDRRSLKKLFGWLNKASSVCGFVKDYVYLYNGYPDAFVPAKWVGNNFHPRYLTKHSRELHEILRGARRLNYIPGLRLNYRKYGLDEETKKAIKELASAK